MLYSRMLDELLTKSEDVGKEFPAEARKIYYQEVRPGQSAPGDEQEHEELLDEGIPVARLPVPPGRLKLGPTLDAYFSSSMDGDMPWKRNGL